MRDVVIGVVRSATHLHEVWLEIEPPKDHARPWESELRFVRRAAPENLQLAWSRLAAVERWDEATLADVLFVLRTTVPALPEHEDLPALRVERVREWRPTAAHPRGYRGAKVRPPKPAQPEPIDVRPYLMTRRHVDQVLEELGERRGDPYVAWNFDVDATAAFDPWFVMSVLPLLRGATWSEVGTFALVAKTFELRDQPKLFAALVELYLMVSDPSRALAWWNHVLGHAPEQRLLTAQLVASSGVTANEPQPPETAARLATLLPVQRWSCYEALGNCATIEYVMSGIALDAISSEKAETLPAGAFDVTELVATTIARLGIATESDSGSEFWRAHLWRMCGDQPGFFDVLSSAAFQSLAPTAAFQVIRLASNTRYPYENADKQWRELRPHFAHIVDVAAHQRPSYQTKFITDTAHLYWFAVDCELDVANAFARCEPLLVNLARPPFAPSPLGRAIYPMAAVRAPDASWLALESAGERDNDARLLQRGLYRLSLAAPSLIDATFPAAPTALIRTAIELSSISFEEAGSLLDRFMASPIANAALSAATIEELCTIVAPIDPTVVRRALRRHLAGEVVLTAAQLAGHRARIVEQLDTVRLAAVRRAVARILAARVGIAAISTPPLRHALEMLGSVRTNRRALRRMLTAITAGDRDWALRHPRTQEWFARHPMVNRDTWLAGIDLDGISIEHDPLEALRLGTYVGTCLGRGGAFEFSAAAVALDANKHVAYARDATGAVIARQLLAISETNELVCFRVYGAAQRELGPRFRELDQTFAAKLGLPIATGDSEVATIVANDWYDDGAWL